LEWWSGGVLDALETELYKPRLRQYGAKIISSVDVWVQNPNQHGAANHFDRLTMPGNAFSNTPTLQYSCS
jgi:hypothetical protein